MGLRQLLSGAILLVMFTGSAGAEEVERTFIGRSLSVAESGTVDFPLAPEAKSESVNDLVAMLNRVRASGREQRVVLRTATLEEVVRSRSWRQGVAHQLKRLFP